MDKFPQTHITTPEVNTSSDEILLSAINNSVQRLNELPVDEEIIEVIGHPFGMTKSEGYLRFKVKNHIDNTLSGEIALVSRSGEGFVFERQEDDQNWLKKGGAGGRKSPPRSILQFIDYSQPVDDISLEIREMAKDKSADDRSLWRALKIISAQETHRTDKIYRYHDPYVDHHGNLHSGVSLELTTTHLNDLLNKISVELSLPYEIDDRPTTLFYRVTVGQFAILNSQTYYLDPDTGERRWQNIANQSMMNEMVVELLDNLVAEKESLANASSTE